MSDPADAADLQVEQFNDFARALRKPTGPLFTGFCAWCDEPVADPLRWCGLACRDDWEKNEGRRDGDA